MRNGFNVALLAAGLAGCSATPYYGSDKPPAQPAFGESFTAEWRKRGQPETSAPAATAASARAFEGTEAERKEFEDWRAWQEWKRNNPR